MVNDEHNLPLKAVQEQLSAFHRTLNSINTPIYAVDSFYCYTNFNQSHIAVMKALYNVGIEIKHSILDYITVAENRVTIRRNIDRALHGEHIVEDTCLGEKPACRYFQESYNPIENDKGEIIGVAVLAQDITDRKLADEKFKVNEQQVQQKLESIIPPDADVSMLELADILDSENIQKLMNEFYQLTHIGIGIIDLHGKVLVGTGWQDICTKFHRVNPESCELCVESDLELSRNVPASTFKLYRCKNNMWDIATPIMLGNRHVGNIFLGQFLFDDEVPDYEIFRQQARRYGFDEQEYLAALDRVPRWSRDTVNAAISFYEAFAGMIGNLSYSNVKLANALKERKRAEEALKESEERLRVTMEATQIGVWDWDVKNDVWYASPTYYTMLGYEPVAGSSDRTLWLTRVHPDDRQAVADKINTVLKGHGTVYQYEARMKHADGSYRWHSVIGSLVQKDENDLPARLMGVRIDINDRKHAEEALLQSEQYKTILNQIANVFLTVPDEEIYGKVLEIVLKIMKSKFGVFGFIDTNGDLVIPSLTRDIWSECQVFDKSTIFPSATWGKSLWGKSIREKRAFLSDGPFHTPAGHITIDQFLTAPIVFANETIGLISVANNECGYTETDKILLENIVNFISPILNARLQRDHKEQERMQAENELSRVNRALQILSDTNHALIHIIDEKTLLKEVCNIAVSVGGYRMVWVGFAEHDEAKNLLPIAYAGYDSGYIESARMSWGDNERGHSPCGISVRTGMPCLVRNILDDPLFTLWRDIAIQHNYKSILALPLISEEQTFGTIGIYSDETDAFDEKEFSILKELADDLAFGITALRMRVKRDKTVEELKKSEEKFRTLIQKIQAAVVVYGPDTQILTSNSKAQELLGLTEKQNQGKTTSDSAWHFFLEDGTIMPVEKYPVNQVIATHQSLMNFVVGVHRPDNNNDVWTLVNADPVFNNYDEIQQVIVTFTDITERKRYESIMQARLRLLEYANSHSLEELLTATLDEMEALTRSKIGFYHFVEADQQTLTLQNWSSNTLKNMCSAEGKGSHYDISTAGVWVDCVYERRPVIHNNYAALSHRKGLPQGHAPVIRELVVPIFRGNIIKAIIGVGNKDTDYNDNDISIVSQLGDLSWDITERKLAENELQATNELLRAIIEAAPTAIIGLDLEGKVQMVWNPSAEHLLGWSQQEVMGKPLPSVPMERQEEYYNFLEKIRSGYTLEGVEVRRQNRDGNLIDYSIYASPLHDTNDEISGSIAVLVDITERKKADEQIKNSLKEKEILLRELYHRTKNNMQVIISLLKMESEYTTNKEALHIFNEMENRIHSMALVHDKLYKSQNLSRIDLKEYITDLINLLFNSFYNIANRVTLKLDLENVSILMDTAIPCGLVLNELLSNSFKHAFPDGKKGEIYVHLSRKGELIKLCVTDNGIGFPDNFSIKKNSKLGLNIITMLVKIQLQGSIKFTSKPGSGVTCRIHYRDTLYSERV